MPIPSHSPSPFVIPRSHLDSASYRSLVRILSVCFDSSSPPPPPPESHPSSNPSSDAALVDQAEALAPGNGADGDACEVLQQGSPRAGNCGIDPESKEMLGLLKRFEVDLCDDEFPKELISDFAARPINFAADVHDERGKSGGNARLDDCENNVTGLVGELEQVEGREQHAVDACNESVSVCVEESGLVVEQDQVLEGLRANSGAETDVGLEKPIMVCMAENSALVALQDGTMSSSFEKLHLEGSTMTKVCSKEPTLAENQVEKHESMQGIEEGRDDGADTLMGSAHLGMDKMCPSSGDDLESDGDIEEGEIPDDFQSEDQCLDSVDETTAIEDDKLDDAGNGLLHTSSNCENSELQKIKGYGDVLALQNVITADPELDAQIQKNLAVQDDLNTSNSKVDAVRKRKRRPLTEERKAKKKKAERKKRARMEREQGVRRLKLQPVVKPKVVKDCGFYLKGRCQKGDMCKFSHATTPLTKSQPCRYFACDTCLKGDDCPFDHELSKYPCHNFTSKGLCIRGDRCKFSHKMPSEKSESLLTSEKLTSKMQATEKNTPKSTCSNSNFSIYEDMKENLVDKCLKPPVRMPSGVRFLSFGKGRSEAANKQQDNMPHEIPSSIKKFNQQSQVKTLADGQKSLSIPSQKPSLTAQASSNASTSKQSKSNNLSSEPASGGLQGEVSAATKILEEFLFGVDAL